MSAAALLGGASSSGPRPINLRTDLGAIATLIETCFADEMDAQGRAAVREMRAISRSGPFLWLLASLNRVVRDIASGYVWVEDGWLVGNVSIYRADTPDFDWVIANVAVHPDFRRRGIARSLMQASLELLCKRKGRSVALQVRQSNLGAIALYRALGFAIVRTWTTWRHPAPMVALERSSPPIEAAQGNDWRDIYALAREIRPTGLGWMRATDASAFRPTLWRWLSDLFSGKVEEQYVVRDGAGVAAALLIGMPLAGRRDALTLLVRPDHQGELERPLLGFALNRLRGRGRAVTLEHPDDDQAACAALEALGFTRSQSLTVMRYDL